MLRGFLRNLGFLVVLVIILYGCGKDIPMESFKGDEYFPPPAPGDVIAPRWIPLTRFGVKDTSSYDALVEVAVKGVSDTSGVVVCQLLTAHTRFRSNRSWSPLPIAFYSVEYQSPDGKEDLNDIFRLTLGFAEKKISQAELTFNATFTRAKVFSSSWRIVPRRVKVGGTDSCTAVAMVQRNTQVACRSQRCAISEVIAEVDSWRHFLARSKPEPEKDDLSGLFLNLENVADDFTPEGGAYTVSVPEFK